MGNLANPEIDDKKQIHDLIKEKKFLQQKIKELINEQIDKSSLF